MQVSSREKWSSKESMERGQGCRGRLLSVFQKDGMAGLLTTHEFLEGGTGLLENVWW